VAIAAIGWLRRGRPRPGQPALRATIVGVAVFAAVTALIAQPYLSVLRDHPEAHRTAAEIAFYSPPPRGFLAAPDLSGLWAGATAQWRDTLRFPGEQALFPGVTVLLLALLGLWGPAFGSRVRLGLGVGTVACAVLSLGLPSYAHPNRGFTPYRLLYDYAPGWDGVRTPGRINTLTSLGLALLAGAGLTVLQRRGVPRAWRHLVAAAAVVAILAEGFGPLPHPRLPDEPAGAATAPAPQLHLPANRDPLILYWSIDGFPKMVNGLGAFVPTRYSQILGAVTGFPDGGSVDYLRRLGVRSVILHRDLAAGTPWQDAAERPTAGLPLDRQDVGQLVIYRLRS